MTLRSNDLFEFLGASCIEAYIPRSLSTIGSGLSRKACRGRLSNVSSTDVLDFAWDSCHYRKL